MEETGKDLKSETTNKDQELVVNDLVGQSSKGRVAIHKEIMDGPARNFLTTVLNQVEIVLPHKKGSESQTELQFNSVRRVLLDEFHKVLSPEVMNKLRGYFVVEKPESKKTVFRFAKPTRAGTEGKGKEQDNGTDSNA